MNVILTMKKLGNLFKKFGYLPLLVEQLAYYLDSDEIFTPRTYDDLIKLFGNDVLHSDLLMLRIAR